MNLQRMTKICLVIIVFFSWGGASAIPSRARPASQSGDPSTAYLPLAFNRYSATSDSIIVDHRHTDVHQIPDEWIEAAKPFVVHYAHTSHGSQILTGLEWLEGQDPKYNIDISYTGLADDASALRFYDGNSYDGNNYITPDMYWESEDGISHTRTTLDTGFYDFSLWTWCGQMSYYSDEQIQTYLDTLEQLDAEYPQVRLIYYTGHTDGSAPGSDLWRHNDMVRQYVQTHGKILFDFADIETYAPDGSGPYYNDGEGNCTDAWCQQWCTNHSANFECQDIPADCAHTHGLACTLKGQAFWWLMARLAGWDGSPTP